ncbi:subtilisin-like protease SBT5.4 [Selaginella moellendorffii]|uniref:subtilisin-like protease SBT5.4 n=1 Tax=Selaginella moellendorffii TaxID=88036 RepID=UPI000D1CAB4C|nr:subtilisin-like protease SBT5.4 [Selaginella moellendorffii]|eukprot:XP_024532743.1 subtilisin-like protease SBT5.4 [Selaginella moellendorffii]
MALFVFHGAALALALLLAFAADFPCADSSNDQASSGYIVYMGSKPESPRGHKLAHSHHRMLASVLHSEEAARESILYSYTRSFNGFSARLNATHVAALKKMPGVLSVFPDKRNQLHTTHSWKFLGLEDENGEIPENSLWRKANFGSGVTIGSLDTGVWPESASFDDSSFDPVPNTWKGTCVNTNSFNPSDCNKKLIGARFYIKAYELSKGPLNTTATGDFRSPRDKDGHGTHTSSTASGRFVEGANILGFANGTAKGGASKARLAVYKVCWPGGCWEADILAAMDDAIADGVDILTLSIGGKVPLPDFFQDGIALGAFHAIQKGITVVCSAGNDGPKVGSVVNLPPWILTVAASSIDRSFSASVILGNNKTYLGSSLSEFKLEDRLYPIVASSDVGYRSSIGSLLCTVGSLDPKKTEGKIVVCLRGVTTRLSKGTAVKQAGGAGLVLANSDADGGELIADPHVLPATNVDAQSGKEIYAYLKNTKSSVGYITPAKTLLGVEPSPKMASFSSQGPNTLTPDILKPDITGPGMNILAAFTRATAPAGDGRLVEFNVESGTSMSCPHLAGIVALLKALHPDWSPAAIKSAIMTTAITYDNTGNKILDGSNKVAGPFNYGAGHVNVNAAADPGLVYDAAIEDYIFFLCGLGYSSVAMETLTGYEVHCPDAKLSLSDFNYPSVTLSNLKGSTTVTRTVTNVGGDGQAEYKVAINPPPGVSVSITPSILKFSSTGEKKSFTLTFTAERSSKGAYVFGDFSWSDGKHQVRSPIAVKATATSGIQDVQLPELSAAI